MTLGKRSCGLGWLLLALLAILALSPLGHAEVRLPTGEYADSVEDLKVKVLGGYVSVTRSWTDGRWYVNPAWADLKLTYDSLDGSVKGIERAGTVYERTSAGLFIYKVDQPFTIQATATGFRWSDTKGNWITYDSNGHLTAYGDRNNVQVSFQLDGSGNRTQIVDQLGQSVLSFQYTGSHLTGVTDRTGRQVHYQYTGDNLTQVTDVLGDTWLYTYDNNGQLITRTDPNGHTTTIVYAQSTPSGTVAGGMKRAVAKDATSAASVASTGATPRDYKIARVFTVTDPENNTTTYLYAYDRVALTYTVTQRFPGGRQVVGIYDSLGRLRQQTTGSRVPYTMTRDGTRTEMVADERGLITKTDFDGNWNPIKVTYPDGTSISATYDSVYNNPLTKTDESGAQTTYQYDAKGNLTQMTEAVGLPEQRVTTYTYDQYGQRLTATRKGVTTADDATTTTTYDVFGNVQTITDAVGNASTYTVDVMGNVLALRDPRENTWTRTYNALGWQTGATDPLGHSKAFTYDKAGNLVKWTNAMGIDTTFTYNKKNWLSSVTDPSTGVVQYEYDAEGRRTLETDASGVMTRYVYDSGGRLSTVTDGNGNITRTIYGDNSNSLNGLVASIVYPTYTEGYKYDQRNRVTQTTQVLDQNTSYTTANGYDGKGNLISTTDALGRTTQYVFDDLNHRTQVIDTIGGVTQYRYDVRDNLTAITDANGHATIYSFDKANRQTSETRPLGGTLGYAYDSNGNLTTRTNAIGEQRRFIYDMANRATQEQQFGATGGVVNSAPSRTITFGYDARNLLSSYDDGTTTASYGYDNKGQKTLETVNFGPFSKTLQYSYQANGKKASFSYPDNTQVQYTYDTSNQLKTLVTPQGTIAYATYQWTAPTQIAAPGVTRTMSYDGLLRPTEIKAQAIGTGTASIPQGSVLLDYHYSYDAVSNITQRQTQDGLYNYSYDNLDRLTTATPPSALQASSGNPNGLPVEGYTYDGVHNRLSSQHQPGPWQYNADNQLLSYGQGSDATTVQYDANGHTVQKTQSGQIQNLSYNPAERLVRVADAGNTTVASYYYDPFGRRISKTIGGAITYYQYASEGLIAEYDSGGTAQTIYGWEPDSVWSTNPAFKRDGSTYHFYINDHLGAPQLIHDIDGAPRWKASSEAFGKTTVDPSSTINNPLRSAGQYFDAETGLFFNQARYYDVDTGRFRTLDPLGLGGGANPFVYSLANPIARADPSGLLDCSAWTPNFDTTGCVRVSHHWEDQTIFQVKETQSNVYWGWLPAPVLRFPGDPTAPLPESETRPHGGTRQPFPFPVDPGTFIDNLSYVDIYYDVFTRFHKKLLITTETWYCSGSLMCHADDVEKTRTMTCDFGWTPDDSFRTNWRYEWRTYSERPPRETPTIQ